MYEIYALKCNRLQNPIGIDTEQPVFSWRLRSDRRANDQIQYRIWVAAEDGTEVWDSGETESDRTFAVRYAGSALKTGRTYTWHVESKDRYGSAARSETGSFTMGVMDADFWKASWIEPPFARKPQDVVTQPGLIFSGMVKSDPHPEEKLDPPVLFRGRMRIDKTVKRAMAYVSARGLYALSVDGRKVSTPLVPGYTAYRDFLEYQTYAVGRFLTVGDHEITCWLADGWYTGKIGLMGIGEQYGTRNALLIQIEIEYEDGSRSRFVTDETMTCGRGRYRYGDLFVGECLDERLKEEEALAPVKTDIGYGNLRGLTAEPVRVLRVIKPVCLRTPAGDWVLDAGENIAGYTKFTAVARRGVPITLEHSEVLDRDGNFQQNIIGQNKNQTDVFVSSVDGLRSFEPQFTFHGFRYVRVRGLQKVQAEDFAIVVLGTDMERTGEFATSDPMLNQLQENIFRSQQGNMISIPTDCPQRERAGWTGDMQVYAPTACFLMDVDAFLRKWLANMRFEQLPDGQIPNVIPSIDSNKYIDGEGNKHVCSAGWGDACVIVPYVLYQTYGDPSVLEENYEMMRRWMDYVEQQAAKEIPEGLGPLTPEQRKRQRYLWNTQFHFGDWLIPSVCGGGMADPMESSKRTKEYVAPAMFAYTAGLMERICGALGKEEEKARYGRLYKNIKSAYSEEYVDENGCLPVQLQGVYVLALAMDLVEERKRPGCVRKLVDLIHENGDCLDTGFLSIPFLLDTLRDAGEKGLAYRLLFQKKCPSWLYEVEQKATTIWESWSAILPDGTRTNSSYNHFAFGCVGDFLYRNILGINALAPGYRRVRVAPDFDCGLTYARGSCESVCGRIAVAWERSGADCRLEAEIPPGVSAVVDLGSERIEVESGRYTWTGKCS